MKLLQKATAGAVAVFAAAGGFLLAAATPASAAGSVPSFQPDANAAGTVSFYDNNGVQQRSGKLSDVPMNLWVKASTNAPAGTKKAVIVFCTPKDNTLPANWPGCEQISSGQSFPQAGAPGSLASATQPVVTDDSGTSLQDHITAFKSTSTNDPNVYEVRIAVTPSGTYWSADVQVDTTAGTWTEVYPAAAAATTTTLTSDKNPAAVGDAVKFTATVSPAAAAGSVQFKDGSANLGSPVAVSGGVASFTTSSLAIGPHQLSAEFTPTDAQAVGGSTGTLTEVIQGKATSTSLAVSGVTSVDKNDETFTATVSPSSVPGSVAFTDNGTAIAGTVTNPSSGQYQLVVTGGLGVGAHSVVATFSSTDPSYGGSASAPARFTTADVPKGACAQTGSVCSEDQSIQATIPVGTLVINTPYDSTHPLDVGTLALDPTGSYFTGKAGFQNIRITDARSGALPWTASALGSDLSDGLTHANSTINAQNVGLTQLTVTSKPGFTGTLATFDNVAAAGVAPGAAGSAGLGGTTPHKIASVDHGPGTVVMDGVLTINAPTSTENGVFTGTITFTVG